MAIKNHKDGRAWIGEELGRGGPVSEKTWARFMEQGMPHGTVGESPVICTIAVGEWLRLRATGTTTGGEGKDSAKGPESTAPRKRGRPRKHWPNS